MIMTGRDLVVGGNVTACRAGSTLVAPSPPSARALSCTTVENLRESPCNNITSNQELYWSLKT